MITAYLNANKFDPQIIDSQNQDLLKTALWIDILNPSKEEEQLLENIFDLDIPTREEMKEIELSSRLYKENNALFMTVTMVAKSDTTEPTSDAVTLILTSKQLLTLRYIEPYSFALFTFQLAKDKHTKHTSTSLLLELLDASIDRLADILEKVSLHLNEYSHTVFHNHEPKRTKSRLNYRELLQEIGFCGDLNTKVEESLISFNRLMGFFGKKIPEDFDKDINSKLNLLTKDTQSLRDHVSFLSNKINFLLDATLGMINIEQNDIIKIFSIAAVVLLPPTLVATIYGMNFHHMPELQWHYGYIYALLLMFFSAWLPYRYFKAKKWL